MSFDAPTQAIAGFAASARDQQLDAGVQAAALRRHLDSIGCALGALDAKPCRIVREIALSARTERGCSVFGIAAPVAPEQAVFANVTMLRQLDFNDISEAAGAHSSDMIPAVVAAAELARGTGLELLRGIYIAYEVAAAIGGAYPVEHAGFDHGGTATAVGAAMGAGSVLGLGPEELANAVAIAATPSMALGVTRKGELSNWKGSASAHESMTGMLAARLAKLGLTGPPLPFEGVGGLDRLVPPTKPVEFLNPAGETAVERSTIKFYPAVGNTIPLIGPLIRAREEINVEDITGISVETFAYMWHNLAGGAGDHEQKWAPKTRETADHSLPYVIAVSLLDGQVTERSFSDERIARRDVRALMERITVTERAEYTARYPAERLSTVTIELRDGTTVTLAAETPPGNHRNPLTDAQFSEKFRGLATTLLPEEEHAAIERLLWTLGELDDLDELTRHYRAITVP